MIRPSLLFFLILSQNAFADFGVSGRFESRVRDQVQDQSELVTHLPSVALFYRWTSFQVSLEAGLSPSQESQAGILSTESQRTDWGLWGQTIFLVEEVLNPYLGIGFGQTHIRVKSRLSGAPTVVTDSLEDSVSLGLGVLIDSGASAWYGDLGFRQLQLLDSQEISRSFFLGLGYRIQ